MHSRRHNEPEGSEGALRAEASTINTERQEVPVHISNSVSADGETREEARAKIGRC